MLSKPELRHHFLSLRKSLNKSDRVAFNHKIFENVVKNPKIREAHTVCCYISYEDEVDTHKIINHLISVGKNVVSPKVSGGILELKKINSLSQCVPGFKGILEPLVSAETVPPQKVDLYIVLGLAFDAFGYRLGFGKGYTDKLLSGLNTYIIGLCFKNQLVDLLPHEDHDVPVMEIITDTNSLVIS